MPIPALPPNQFKVSQQPDTCCALKAGLPSATPNHGGRKDVKEKCAILQANLYCGCICVHTRAGFGRTRKYRTGAISDFKFFSLSQTSLKRYRSPSSSISFLISPLQCCKGEVVSDLL